MTTPAVLALEDGTVFHGVSIGANGNTTGEVVFNTAMTGYQEILTDPSYCRQIVTLTYPHIGNTGTNPEDLEAAAVYAAGLVIRDLPAAALELARDRIAARLPAARQGRRDRRHRHAQADAHPAREGRAGRLHRERRDRGRAPTCGRRRAPLPRPQGHGPRQGRLDQAHLPVERGHELGARAGPQARPGQRLHVVAYDFGIKRNILRLLADHGCRITVVPAQTPADEVLAMQPDGVFLSNGPGDPEPCTYAIEAIREFLEAGIPMFGICLGHQLLGLASGAKTVKMKFGHHGANHPVLDLESGRVLISSQNHGFAVDEATLPANVRATHQSLFDGSLQGIDAPTGPPSASRAIPRRVPGPHDVAHALRPLRRIDAAQGHSCRCASCS